MTTVSPHQRARRVAPLRDVKEDRRCCNGHVVAKISDCGASSPVRERGVAATHRRANSHGPMGTSRRKDPQARKLVQDDGAQWNLRRRLRQDLLQTRRTPELGLRPVSGRTSRTAGASPYADQGDAAKRIVLRGWNDRGPARRPALSRVDASHSGRPDARGAWLSRYLIVRAEPDLAQASR